jgi:hypothetical protein
MEPAESSVLCLVLLADDEIEREVSFSPHAKQCFKLVSLASRDGRCVPLTSAATCLRLQHNSWFWERAVKKIYCYLDLSIEQYANNIRIIVCDQNSHTPCRCHPRPWSRRRRPSASPRLLAKGGTCTSEQASRSVLVQLTRERPSPPHLLSPLHHPQFIAALLRKRSHHTTQHHNVQDRS